jgi:hypothetical protein
MRTRFSGRLTCEVLIPFEDVVNFPNQIHELQCMCGMLSEIIVVSFSLINNFDTILSLSKIIFTICILRCCSR